MAVKPGGRASQVLGVYAFFLGVTTVAIAFRVYCRARLVKNFALDDWFALISWAFFVSLCAFAITGCYHGTGQHAWEIKPASEIPIGLKWWWVCEPVYVLSNMAIKASIAVMLLRLTIERTQRLIIWTTIIITELYSASFFFLFIFQCSPPSYFWTQWTGGKGSCINPHVTVNSTYVYSAITCAGDWIFAILPFFMVWKLQMEKRQKYLVALILAMGAIASTATIIRIPYVSSLSNVRDFLYATTDVAIWSCCETGLGITAASAATLRPLFREWKFLSASHATGAGRGIGAYGGGSGANGIILRRTPSHSYGGIGHRYDSWPPGVGVGYVRSQGQDDLAFPGKGKASISPYVSVEEDTSCSRHGRGGFGLGVIPRSERSVKPQLKALPPIPARKACWNRDEPADGHV